MPIARDRPGPAQFLQRPVAALAQRAHQRGMRLGTVLVGADVVHIEDVDPRQPEPLQAVLERPHDAVIRIVVDRVERHHMARRAAIARARVRPQQAADLGRQHPLVARPVAQRVADAALGLADAVIGGGGQSTPPPPPGGGGHGPPPPPAGPRPGGPPGGQPSQRGGRLVRRGPRPAAGGNPACPASAQLPLGLYTGTRCGATRLRRSTSAPTIAIWTRLNTIPVTKAAP